MRSVLHRVRRQWITKPLFTGVRKTIDGTEEQFAAVDKGLKELSKTTPVSAAELANLAAVGGQLGIETGETGETILKFTKTMADMARQQTSQVNRARRQWRGS